MPITELATFRLKEPYTIDSEDLYQNFISLACLQSEWSKFPLTFYVDVEDSAIVYLLSGWDDVPAHIKWIESDANQELLKMFDPFLSIIAFAHIDIDFTEIPFNTQTLAFKQEILPQGGTLAASTIGIPEDLGGFQLWLGQGRGLEHPEDLYFLGVYAGLEQVKKGFNGSAEWKIMRRRNFN